MAAKVARPRKGTSNASLLWLRRISAVRTGKHRLLAIVGALVRQPCKAFASNSLNALLRLLWRPQHGAGRRKRRCERFGYLWRICRESCRPFPPKPPAHCPARRCRSPKQRAPDTSTGVLNIMVAFPLASKTGSDSTQTKAPPSSDSSHRQRPGPTSRRARC